MFILPGAQCGGAENVLISICQNLPTETFDPIILTIDNEGPLLKRITDSITTLTLNRKKVSRAFLPLIRNIRSICPDIIFTSICHLNLAILLLKPFMQKNIKIIIRESNILSYSLNKGGRIRILQSLVKWLYPKANCIICLGREMKEDLRNNYGIPEDRIVIISNPVDITKIKQMALNSEMPFVQDKINLLSVGSLTHQKGFDILINAFEIVVSELSNVHLTILGDGPLKGHLRQLIADKQLASNITMAGFKENPYPYFYHADHFILSSRYEGLPNVVLEAVALGTPVIAFDNPGCIREILPDFSNGRLVKPCTADALAQAILKSCKHPDRSGIPALSQKFDLKNVSQKYQALFLEC